MDLNICEGEEERGSSEVTPSVIQLMQSFATIDYFSCLYIVGVYFIHQFVVLLVLTKSWYWYLIQRRWGLGIAEDINDRFM